MLTEQLNWFGTLKHISGIMHCVLITHVFFGRRGLPPTATKTTSANFKKHDTLL